MSTSARGSEAGPAGWAITIVALIVLAGGLVMSSAGSRAADQPAAPGGLRLAVVDFGMIRREAAAVQSINNQLETRVTAYQKDIEKEEDELKTAQKALDAQRQHLSADAYSAAQRRWEKDVSEAQRRFLSRRQTLEKARAAAWRQVNQRVDRIIKDIATERQIDVIVRRDQTVFVAPRLEITDDVLGRLNKELPSVQLLPPGG